MQFNELFYKLELKYITQFKNLQIRTIKEIIIEMST